MLHCALEAVITSSKLFETTSKWKIPGLPRAKDEDITSSKIFETTTKRKMSRVCRYDQHTHTHNPSAVLGDSWSSSFMFMQRMRVAAVVVLRVGVETFA